MNPITEKRGLEQTLQALYDSEINVTITMLWDGGVDFALVSYMEYDDSTPDDWHNIRSFAELADGLHKLALRCTRRAIMRRSMAMERCCGFGRGAVSDVLLAVCLICYAKNKAVPICSQGEVRDATEQSNYSRRNRRI